MGDRKRKNKSNRSGLDNRTKGLGVIKPFLLMKALCYEAGFSSFDSPICTVFGSEDPPIANNVRRRGRGNKSPSVIFQESMELIFHGLTPFSEMGSSGIRCWFFGCFNGGGETIGKLFWTR